MSVGTLFRGKDEETRQKAAENTDAHISSPGNRIKDSFLFIINHRFSLLLCFRLSISTNGCKEPHAQANLNYLVEKPPPSLLALSDWFHDYWRICCITHSVCIINWSKVAHVTHPTFVSIFKFKLPLPLSASPIYLWVLTKQLCHTICCRIVLDSHQLSLKFSPQSEHNSARRRYSNRSFFLPHLEALTVCHIESWHIDFFTSTIKMKHLLHGAAQVILWSLCFLGGENFWERTCHINRVAEQPLPTFSSDF